MFKSKSISFICVLLFMGLAACNNSMQQKKTLEKEKKQVDSLYELVVAGHDSVMPKISHLEALQGKLRKKLEALPEGKSSTFRKDSILNLLSGLQKGHDAMFDWMGAFKNIYTSEDFYKNTKNADLMAYLKSEELKIKEVARLMLESMEKAEAFINEE